MIAARPRLRPPARPGARARARGAAWLLAAVALSQGCAGPQAVGHSPDLRTFDPARHALAVGRVQVHVDGRRALPAPDPGGCGGLHGGRVALVVALLPVLLLVGPSSAPPDGFFLQPPCPGPGAVLISRLEADGPDTGAHFLAPDGAFAAPLPPGRYLVRAGDGFTFGVDRTGGALYLGHLESGLTGGRVGRHRVHDEFERVLEQWRTADTPLDGVRLERRLATPLRHAPASTGAPETDNEIESAAAIGWLRETLLDRYRAYLEALPEAQRPQAAFEQFGAGLRRGEHGWAEPWRCLAAQHGHPGAAAHPGIGSGCPP